MSGYNYNNGWYKEIWGQPISKEQYYFILRVYDDVCAENPSLTEYSGYNKAATQLRVSPSLVKAVVDDRRTYGCPVQPNSYPVQPNSYPAQQSYYPTQQQSNWWYKEFYGRSISKELYYKILESFDSEMLLYPSLGVQNAIEETADDLDVSVALVAAVVQDRQNSNGR